MGDKEIVKTLLVEDEQIAMEAYETIIKALEIESKYSFAIEKAYNCQEANTLIEDAMKSQAYDLVLLDIRIPAYKNGNLLSGEAIGVKIKTTMPLSKIIIFTQYKDPYVLDNLYFHVKPESLLIKNEINSSMLKGAIKDVLDGKLINSQQVTQMMCKQARFGKRIDKKHRQLLYELAHGAKMKDLPDVLKVSRSSIERMRNDLKIIFNVVGESDRNLIMAAKKKGFL